MATPSEIQVTEAYIGLLGRAPDPDGLAYWTAQLDAAIASGQSAAVALKKLTNDITLSSEWDGGLGQYDATTLAGATDVVEGMYLNLFERAATQDDVDYWAPKIVSGEFTASEMAVALIQGAQLANDGAGNADSQTLALKQEAATYYAENVPQDDFNRVTAQAAVDSVDSPNTLKASKEATDIIASGVGVTVEFTTGTDTVAVTGGSDTATGTVGTGETYTQVDSFLDLSTTDNDTMTLTGDAGFDFGATSNVENINISLASRDLAGGYTIEADNDTGGSTINLTVAETVEVGGMDLDGETTVTVNNLASNLTTTNVTDLTVTLDPASSQTFTLGAALATLDIGAVDSNDTTVTLANNDVTFALLGTAAENDAISITADNEVTINVGAQDVEDMTLAGSNGGVVYTVAGVNDANDITYTVSGANDVTLAGSAESFSGAGFTDSSTGAETLQLTATAGAASIENFGVLSGGIELAADAAFNLLLASGNTVTTTAAITAGAITLNANDTATDSSLTLALTQNTNGINTDKFESVTITTNDSKANSLGALDFDGVGSVTITGANDITTGAVSNANAFEVSGADVVIGAVTATNEVTLTGTGSATTDAVTSAGDVTVTGGTGDAVIGDAVTITAGDLEATGDDVNVANTVAVTAGDITFTSTGNDVDLENTVTATAGTVTMTAAGNVEAANTITSTAGSVKLSAGNDIDVAAITAQNDVDIDAGSGTAAMDIVDVGTITVTSGNVTLDGDDVNQTAGGIDVAAGNITVTASNNVDMDAAIDTDSGSLKITATAGSVNLDAVAIGANDVTITSGTTITDASTITSNNDVTFTTADGAGNDIAHTGTINVSHTGNVLIDGDGVVVDAIDVNAGNITIQAANEAQMTGAIDTDSGSIIMTSGIVAGATLGLDIDNTVDANNDITLTATANVDIAGAITSSAGDVTITGNEIDSTAAIEATAGDVKLTATSTDKATDTSTIGANIIAGDNVNFLDGNYDINGTVTATDTVTVEGDTDLDVDDIDAAAVLISTSNDVTVNNTIDSSLIIASGTGDTDLGTVEYDFSTAEVTITTAGGNDTMVLDDDANISVYTVTTGGGIDNVTIAEVAANSVINTQAGDDIISITETGVAMTVGGGDGNDAITVADGVDATINGGNDTDTIKVATTTDLSDDGVTWTNIEKLEVTGGNGGLTLNEAQMDNDGTWEYQNTSGTINVVAGAGTVDASQVTFVAGSSAGFDIVGVDAQADTLTGSSNADVLDGGTGADDMTGGGGADTFEITAGDSLVAGYDQIADFNTGGADVIDHSVNLVKATDTSGTGATSGNASIDAGGLATFHADDTTLALKVAAVAADIEGDTSNTAGLVAMFVHDGNTYVFITDADGTTTTGDDLIELTGVSNLTTITIVGDNFTGG